jgi:protein phosphatase
MAPPQGLGEDAATMPEQVIGRSQLSWAASTHAGNVRELNEDSYLAEPPVFAVADGMGGHDAGEVASALTIERLRRLMQPDTVTIEDVSAELARVNSLLHEAGTPGSTTSMGTTGVGIVMVDTGGTVSWLVFNIGDSRAYCFADGDLIQLSHDHSYVQELVDAGRIAPTEARDHPHKNVITRALGADEDLDADFWVRPVRPHERFLLCSDGLTGEVTDEEIRALLAEGRPAGETVDELINMALRAGGRDNVTALVIDVLSAPSYEAETTGRRLETTAQGETRRQHRIIADVPYERDGSLALAGAPRGDGDAPAAIAGVPASMKPTAPDEEVVAPTLIEAMPGEIEGTSDG